MLFRSLCALLLPLYAQGALVNVFEAGGNRIVELIVASSWSYGESWQMAIQTALLILPVFLLINRGIILIRKSASRGLELKPERKYRLKVVPAMIFLVTAAMVIQILLIPGSRIPPSRRYITEEEAGDIISLHLDDLLFQDSRIVTVRLQARGRPVRFDLALESKNGASLQPVYSAPVPFERENDGRSIVFSLGEGAPNPLTMEIVLPLYFQGLLKASAVYNTWDPSIDPQEDSASVDYVLYVTKTVDLRP